MSARRRTPRPVTIRMSARKVSVGTLAYPRGQVTEVIADSPITGWTTIHVLGADRWNLQATDVHQYRPDGTFVARPTSSS